MMKKPYTNGHDKDNVVSIWDYKFKQRLKSKKTLTVIGTWIGIILLILLFKSCAPMEVLPGLCYTDKTGTYLCEQPAPTVNNPEGQRATSEELVCYEEQENGVFIDICRGLEFFLLNN